MFGWYVGIAATLLALLIYLAFFFKFNWVRDLRDQSKSQRNGGVGLKSRKVGKTPPVYPNGWFALLESSQLKKGQVKHVSALGENFAVFRTEKGVVNILNAYCPHLGANIAEGGHVKGDCLECPFHSWLFRGEDGYCDSIPYAEKVPHIARTKAWKCCEVNQYIFVWYHAESAEPDWRLQPQMCIANGTWHFQGRNEFLVKCHVQDIAENGADCAHFSAVHERAMFLTGNIPFLARHAWTNIIWRPQCPNKSSEADANMETEAEVQIKLNDSISNGDGDHLEITESVSKGAKHKASVQMHHSLILFDRFTLLNSKVNVEQIGPGYVELMINTSFGPICILQTVTPLEPLLQRVTHQVFSPPLLAPYAKVVFLGECLMFERDMAIWNHKKYERQPILVREDRAILAYRRWYSQFYSANSPTYQTATNNLQW